MSKMHSSFFLFLCLLSPQNYGRTELSFFTQYTVGLLGGMLLQKKILISSLYFALPTYVAAMAIAKVARNYSKQFNDEYNQKNESLWKVITLDMVGIAAATVVQTININYALKVPAVAKAIAFCDTRLASVSHYVMPRFVPVTRWCTNYHLGAIAMTLAGITCWNECDKRYPDKYKMITEFFSKK